MIDNKLDVSYLKKEVQNFCTSVVVKFISLLNEAR